MNSKAGKTKEIARGEACDSGEQSPPRSSDEPRSSESSIIDKYRPLGLRAVAAAHIIKRPRTAVRSNDRVTGTFAMPTGFWQGDPDDQ